MRTLPVILLLVACQGGALKVDSDPAPDDSSAVDSTADDSATDDSHSATDDSEEPAPEPVPDVTITPLRGAPPLEVSFDATASDGSGLELTAAWDYGDDATGEGLEATHTYASSGVYTATLTLSNAEGSSAEYSAQIFVQSEQCPAAAAEETLGEVSSGRLTELSGVVESRQNPGVLWVHNDRNNGPQLYAINSEGRLLGTWTITGGSNEDWEDIAIGQDPDGQHVLYIGDVGDNTLSRTWISILKLIEPQVSPTQEEVTRELAAELLELSYPDAARNSETILHDPVSQDLFVVTKSSDGVGDVFRKAAPHAAGLSTLEPVAPLNFSQAPLTGSTTTAGDISPDGSQIIIRTYRQEGYLWLRGSGQTVAEALAGVPCELALPDEPQSESVGFTWDGAGLWTVSEGSTPDVNRVMLRAP